MNTKQEARRYVRQAPNAAPAWDWTNEDILATRVGPDGIGHRPAAPNSMTPACPSATTGELHRIGAYVAVYRVISACRECFPTGYAGMAPPRGNAR